MAAVAQDWLQYFEEDGKRRQVEAGQKYGEGHRKELPETPPEALASGKNRANESREKAAAIFNVSGRSVGTAKAVKKADPELAGSPLRLSGTAIALIGPSRGLKPRTLPLTPKWILKRSNQQSDIQQPKGTRCAYPKTRIRPWTRGQT